MLTGPDLRKADVVFAACLTGFGAAIILSTLDMPWGDNPRGLTRAWYLSPGLFPMVLGALLILFSLRIFLHALKEGGHRGLAPFLASVLPAALKSRIVHRVLVMWALMAAYIFSLKTYLDYYAATALFLFVFMALFYRPRTRSRRPLDFALLAAVAVGVPVGLGFVFEDLLATPLP